MTIIKFISLRKTEQFDNAMFRLTVLRDRLNKLISLAESADGVTLAVGSIALIVGILVDVFILRLLCLFLVLASASILYLTMRAKQTRRRGGLNETSSLFLSQTKSEDMKKILFDDFQPHESGHYRIEEIESQESASEPISTSGEASTSENTSQILQSFKVLKPEIKPPSYEFQIGDFFDIDSDIFKSDAEPKTEFDFLLSKILAVIKDVVFAHSVVFFWANREKEQMVMEARKTDSSDFMASRRYPIGHDLVSNVAETGKPELVTEVNPLSEQELFPYYVTPANVKSFVGVPVFFSNTSTETNPTQPVAVIAVDSKVEGAFGEETVSLLGQFTKLMSTLIKNYTGKYDLLLDSELLASIKRVQERFRNDFSLETVLQCLPEEASRLVSWDFLSVVLFDEKKHAWAVKKLMNRAYAPYISPEQVVDFPESIVGHTIKNTIPYVVDDLSEIKHPRYYRDESAELKGSFLSLPMCSISKCYGALVVESREVHNFSRREVNVLTRLVEPVAFALDMLSMSDIIKEYVIVDDATGVYSKKFFLQRIDEELQRSDDSGTELSLLQITVDHADEINQRYGSDGFDRVMVTLAKGIRSSIRPYDIVGRLRNDGFGVMLVNTVANEAYLWGEKIRKNVAGHVIVHEGKSFSITISVGVAGALDGMGKEDLLGNTSAVLNKASESGGNTVRVF